MYVHHAASGTDVVSAQLAEWTFEWIAPVDSDEPVVFHASANSARVFVGRTNGRLEIEIQDNGIGFSTDEIQQDGVDRYGLDVMRERAAAIGADFVVDATPGNGARIQITMPLGQRHAVQ